MSNSKNLVLVGFANSGKTTLNNQLSGDNKVTGNWGGVTVSAGQSTIEFQQETFTLVDLPGIPSLSEREVQGKDLSISQNYLSENHIDLLINVVDASQLQRQLFLTSQLLELGLPMVVVLTKTDRKEASEVDVNVLSEQLSCPVFISNKQTSLSFETLHTVLNRKINTDQYTQVPFTQDILDAKDRSECSSTLTEHKLQLDSDCHCQQSQPLLVKVMQQRHEFIRGILKVSLIRDVNKKSLSDNLDEIILHPLTGFPFFLAMMYLLFMFAINVGSAFIDFFDILAGGLFVDYPQQLLAQFDLPTWILTIIEGIGLGIQTVATFIPVIVCLFIGLTLLENSGYLARAAFVVDSLMQKIGLPGKAFVPLIVGFGCTVPAVMSARVLDSERERITTVMMSPFMSCGARLPVYALFAAAFFPDSGQDLVFLLYLIGIVAAIFTGLLLKLTVLPGKTSLNIMELPLYEMPSIKHMFKRVWQRTRSFIVGAGQTIVIVVCVLNFFNSLGTDGEFGHQDTQGSLLSTGSQYITPMLYPMGIKEDNWQAGVGIITGIFAKEALVATFNNLYSQTTDEEAGNFDLSALWQDAVGSVPFNLGEISADDPLSMDVGDISSIELASQQQDVEIETYVAMQQAFDGEIGAFAYLLFILLYTPCAAAMGAIKNEVGTRWATFAGLWSFTLAYLSATLCYQISQLVKSPMSSTTHILLVILSFLLIFFWLKRKGKGILTIPTVVKYS